MEKYSLGIVNIGKTLLIIGLIIILDPLIFYVITIFDSQFIKENIVIALLIFILPIGFLIIWMISQKFKDIFKVTSIGVESENHGIIKWTDVENCSWETIKGSVCIYLKLKNRKRFYISVDTFKDYSKRYNDLRNFFNEIQQARENLPEKDRFLISEQRISGVFTIGFVVFIIGLLITLIIFNMIKK